MYVNVSHRYPTHTHLFLHHSPPPATLHRTYAIRPCATACRPHRSHSARTYTSHAALLSPSYILGDGWRWVLHARARRRASSRPSRIVSTAKRPSVVQHTPEDIPYFYKQCPLSRRRSPSCVLAVCPRRLTRRGRTARRLPCAPSSRGRAQSGCRGCKHSWTRRRSS